MQVPLHTLGYKVWLVLSPISSAISPQDFLSSFMPVPIKYENNIFKHSSFRILHVLVVFSEPKLGAKIIYMAIVKEFSNINNDEFRNSASIIICMQMISTKFYLLLRNRFSTKM